MVQKDMCSKIWFRYGSKIVCVEKEGTSGQFLKCCTSNQINVKMLKN